MSPNQLTENLEIELQAGRTLERGFMKRITKKTKKSRRENRVHPDILGEGEAGANTAAAGGFIPRVNSRSKRLKSHVTAGITGRFV